MKKILILGPFPFKDKGINGMSIANQTLYEGLQNKYKVKKINTSKELEFIDKKEQGKFKFKKFFIIVKELINEILHMLSNRYDVIYMTPGQSFLGFLRFGPYMLISFLKKTPCYIHIHGSFFRKMYDGLSIIKKKILLYFLRRLSGVIVLGTSLKYMLKGLVNDSNIFVCENGVQDYIVASEKEIFEKIEKLNQNNKRKILYLSNLMEEKGILDLLEASKRFTDNEVEINLAGAIEPSIKSIIDSYLKEYPKKIKYYGIVTGKSKKKLFLENQIFILPSRDEGQPISILEAYVTGNIVITDNNIGGIKDIFEDNKNGYSCRINDPESIYQAIKLYLKNNNMIINNFTYGIKNFTSKVFIEKLTGIILGDNK